MNVSIRTTHGLIAVTDDLGRSTRTVHKYAVVVDGRRKAAGKHSTGTTLENVVVEHSKSVTIHDGRVVDFSWTPDPRASRELVELGATVQIGDRDDAPEVPA